VPAEGSPVPAAGTALMVGGIGLAVTALAAFIADPDAVALSYLVGLTYWTAIAIGVLLMCLIHHIFDASWSVVIRRQWEHGLSAFTWLGILFVPLVLATFLYKLDLIWPWMNPDHPTHGGPVVANDPLYLKKSAFLNIPAFVASTAIFFLLWIWLSARLRKASFSQDADGDVRWTFMNRRTAAFGIPIVALTLTGAAIYWVKSLEYHWFSTMYGVWFFTNCMRGALSIGVIIMIWLWNRGDYRGILNKNHLHSIGQLMLAFTVFWAYITFSQYFLIWNANIPEETFWYNIRELNHDGSTNQWWYVGMVILFGHFFLPFFALLSYRFKVTHATIRRIAWWILAIILVDMMYNILPALKDTHGDPLPFFSLNLLWVLTSVIGVGGICVWAYLRSFPTARIIPLRDPRIVESLTHHD
jgi:hypothetical protein